MSLGLSLVAIPLYIAGISGDTIAKYKLNTFN